MLQLEQIRRNPQKVRDEAIPFPVSETDSAYVQAVSRSMAAGMTAMSTAKGLPDLPGPYLPSSTYLPLPVNLGSS